MSFGISYAAGFICDKLWGASSPKKILKIVRRARENSAHIPIEKDIFL